MSWTNKGLVYHALALLVLLLLALVILDETDGGFIFEGALAVDPSTMVHEMPGALDYGDHTVSTIWSYWDNDEPDYGKVVSMVADDIDRDGIDDVVFGTLDHHLIAIRMPSCEEVLNLTFPHTLFRVAVGNVDDDASREVIVHSGGRVYCVDIDDREVCWSTPFGTGIWSETSPIRFTDEDGDGVEDILVSSRIFFYRISGNGSVVYSTCIDQTSYEEGPEYTFIVDDIDGDGADEVFLNDRGWNYDSYYGRRVCILDVASGELEYSRVFMDLILGSNPVHFTSGGRHYIAMGLIRGKADESSDLMVMDVESKEVTEYDVLEGEWYDANLQHLALVPTSDGPSLVLDEGNMAMWSFTENETVWTKVWSGSAHPHEVFTCDADNDGHYEVLSTQVHQRFFDISDGTMEAELLGDFAGGASYRTLLGDLDGDGLTELCNAVIVDRWGEDTRHALVVLDTPAKHIEWPAGDACPTVLYAGIENELGFAITNVSEHRVPESIIVDLSSYEMGLGQRTILSLKAMQVSEQGSGYFDTRSFDHALVDDRLEVVICTVPSWLFPYVGLNDVAVSFQDSLGREVSRTFEDAFRVERHLVLTGTLAASTEEGPVENGSWLPPSERLVMTGFGVVYKGTEDLEAPRHAYSLEVFDLASTWGVAFGPGDPLSFEVTVANFSVQYELSVKLVHAYMSRYGEGHLYFDLRVDATPPTLCRRLPWGIVDDVRSASWNDPWVAVHEQNITIYAGEHGSGISYEGVRYALMAYADEANVTWMGIDPGDLFEMDYLFWSPGGYAIHIEPCLEDGATYILWEVSDRLGNRARQWHVVSVDTVDPDVVVEGHGNWTRDREVSFRVEVSDTGGSGVDGTSIEYSISHTEPLTFENWYSAGEYADSESLSIVITIEAQKGFRDHIIVRARDVAGNQGLSSTQWFQVDTTPPRVVMGDFMNDTKMDPRTRLISVVVIDDGIGVGWIDPHLEESRTREPVAIRVSKVSNPEGGVVVSITWNGSTEPELCFRITVSDGLVNSASYGPVRFYLNQPPKVVIQSPIDGSVFEEGERILFHVGVTDPDLDHTTVQWRLNGLYVLSDAKWFEHGGLEVGNHTIVVSAHDGYYTVEQEVSFSILEPPGDVPEEPGPPPIHEGPGIHGMLFLLGIFSLVIVILGIIYAIIMRSVEE